MKKFLPFTMIFLICLLIGGMLFLSTSDQEESEVYLEDGNIGMYVNSVYDTYTDIQKNIDSFEGVIVDTGTIISEGDTQTTVTVSILQKDAGTFVTWLGGLTTDKNITGYKSVIPIDVSISDEEQRIIHIFITDVDVL